MENVQILVSEELGVEGRAGYYDKSGALRDMVQNHLTQLLTLVAMEPPSAFDADSIRYEKIKVLRSLSPLQPEDVTLGQYAEGTIGGARVELHRVRAPLELKSQSWHAGGPEVTVCFDLPKGNSTLDL